MTLTLLIMLGGWAVESVVGWPDWLFRRISHPVVWLGTLITWLEARLNNPKYTQSKRAWFGALTTAICVSVSALFGWCIALMSENTPIGIAIQILCVSSLLASKSLYDHVHAVRAPLEQQDLVRARTQVAKIVGRDTRSLEETGIACAGLESLAENTSDGVTAPLLWGCLFGLPGIAAYKAINTLDSMIGHKSERYQAFGRFAARLDDAANLVPARLTGLLFSASSASAQAVKAMLHDARRHASPNAGWPEAAMAGALGIRLGGPRIYAEGSKTSEAAWLNRSGRPARADDLGRGLALYVRAMVLLALLVAGVLFASAVG